MLLLVHEFSKGKEEGKEDATNFSFPFLALKNMMQKKLEARLMNKYDPPLTI